MSRKAKSGAGKGRGMLSKIADALEIAPGSMGFEMSGRGEFLVHGCTRIAEYSCEKIRLETRSGDIIINGEKLSCGFFASGTVKAVGKIRSVELSEAE